MPLFIRQGIQPFVADPGDVRRAGRAVREIEAGGRTEDLSGAVAAGPLFKLENEFAVPTPATSCFRRHNDDVSFGGAFDPQIAIELTELEELFVIHVNDRARMDDQGFLPYE